MACSTVSSELVHFRELPEVLTAIDFVVHSVLLMTATSAEHVDTLPTRTSVGLQFPSIAQPATVPQTGDRGIVISETTADGDILSSSPIAPFVSAMQSHIAFLQQVFNRYLELPAVLDPHLPLLLNPICSALEEMLAPIAGVLPTTLEGLQAALSADDPFFSSLNCHADSQNDTFSEIHPISSLLNLQNASIARLCRSTLDTPFFSQPTVPTASSVTSVHASVSPCLSTSLEHTPVVISQPWKLSHDLYVCCRTVAVHSLFQLLYSIVKVRGPKKVVKFFPNAVHLLETLVSCTESLLQGSLSIAWSSLYCSLLWLSLVVLVPFDFKCIDSMDGEASLLSRIYNVGLACLSMGSKVSEGAAIVLAKLFTRSDMYNAKLPKEFFHHCCIIMKERGPSLGVSTPALNHLLGILGAINEILKIMPHDDAQPYLKDILELLLEERLEKSTFSSIRKIRISCLCRCGLQFLPNKLASWRYYRGVRTLMLSSPSENEAKIIFAGHSPIASMEDKMMNNKEEEEIEEDVPEEVETLLSHLLEGLYDRDTIVRWASAKGVGRIAERLSKRFSDQIVEYIISLFEIQENEKGWHGGCLALAEISRRGLLLPERLPLLLPLLSKALLYENQRGFTMVGSIVRDAACYVCWSFARTFSRDILKSHCLELSVALLQVALFDSEINCRRAAAAAIQEHVGRQGVFPNGIELVTEANFFSLAHMSEITKMKQEMGERNMEEYSSMH